MVTSKRDGDRPRGTYHHGNLRAEAIAAALERIRMDGGPVFSLRDIAGTIGVSHGALYRHFTDRDALLAAVATEGFTALLEAHQATLARAGDDSRDRLLAICRAHFGFALARPAEYRTMFNAFLYGAGRDDRLLQAAAQRALDVLVAAMTAWQHATGVGAPAGHEASVTLWSAVHGFTMLTLAGLMPKLTDRDKEPYPMLEVIVSTTLAGLMSQ